MVGLLSAAGLVGFLSEPDPELQAFALRSANENITLVWTEFASSVGQVEALYEDTSFPERELAALVAAKIYYYLQEYDESMVFALGAGKLFDIDCGGEFEDTIISKCIDSYVALQSQTHASTESDRNPSQLDTDFPSHANGSANTSASLTSPTTPFSQAALPSRSLLSRQDSSSIETAIPDGKVDGALPGPGGATLSTGTQKALNAVIRRIFERCFQEGDYRQVVGIAVEAKNLEVMREAITRSSKSPTDTAKAVGQPGKEELMDYLLDICMNVVQERGLRDEILRLVLDMLASSAVESPDYFAIARCIVYLDQHPMASDLLRRLVEQGDSRSLTIAYQTSFDLCDNGSQDFLTKVTEALPQTQEEESSEFPTTNGHATQPNHDEGAQESDQLLSNEQDSSNGPSNTTIMPTRSKPSTLTSDQRKAYASIRNILSGTKSLELNVEFLLRANQADRHVMMKLKNSLEARNSVFHSATALANGFMYSGTTSDWFIRENLDWLGKATNWSKFSVTASLGVIHRGNIGQGQKLMAPYLNSPYSKGGAFYGMGLIYANHGKHISDYLFDELKKSSTDEIVQHGAALGLGVATMASGAEHIVDELKTALWQESAISGQAAGLSMGLVLLGTGKYAALKDMLQYAQDTEHDKTVRGLALGMALIMYAQQEAADVLINGLLDDPDPSIRYGGIMTIALAYCGTSSNKAVRRLLHVAVSDVNDDVRRVAVMSLGFVLFRKPHAVPRMVELLAESYNPHVRYGAAMALGIACAGTGLEEAVDLLEPMMKDSSDFVRQGTLIALSMIMVQQTEAMNPKVTIIRKQLLKTVSDRHEEAITKFGAALALGIIDAGGRNCTISLQTQTGNLNMSAIVGMAVFTQYWYWFPFGHFLSLAFTPTSVIAVDQDLEVPQTQIFCNARQSTFDYPPSMEVKTEEAPEKVKTAVLSTTAQAKRRKIAKEKQSKGDSMDVDDDAEAKSPETPKANGTDDKMDVDETGSADKDQKATSEEGKEEQQLEDGSSTAGGSTSASKRKAEKERIGFEISNMSRVVPSQLRHTSFPEKGRYVPVKKPTGGVILVTDTTPSEPKTLIERQVPKKPTTAAPAAANASSNNPSTPARGGIPPLGEMNTNDDVAAVLNAVDEDDEGGIEADVPGEFEYQSDGEGGGSDD